MLETLLWWLSIQALGLAAMPLAVHLLRFLPDRGYAFARPMGLLLTAYALWIGATFGFLANRRATILLLAIALGAFCWWRWGTEALRLLKGRRSLVIATEALFFGLLAFWVLIRAFDPAISGTEKPMEFAFLNAILRSPSFPPPDPWLAGFSISYYYFGYIMMAMLIKLSGIPSHLTFGLIGALLLALSGTGIFSLAYNLAEGIRRRWDPTPDPQRPGSEASQGSGISASPRDTDTLDPVTGDPVGGPSAFILKRGPLLTGLLAVMFLLFLGNLEGFFEVANARGALSPGFASSLQIKDFPPPPAAPVAIPADNWWWWRASRVVGTFDAAGNSQDYTINEFPFFSFLLGDVHPHVLALPFVILGLAFSLNVLRMPAQTWWKQMPRTLVTGLVFGALGFLNTWDMPTFLAIYIVAFAAGRFLQYHHFNLDWMRHWLSYGAALGGLALLFYLPFYTVFRSQASGIGVVIFHSKLHHFLIFWSPFLLLAGGYLAWHTWAWLRDGLYLPVGAISGEKGTVRPEFILPPLAVAILGMLAAGIGTAVAMAGIPVLGVLLPAVALGLGLMLRWAGIRATPVVHSIIPSFSPGGGSVGVIAGFRPDKRRGAAPAKAWNYSGGREHFFVLLLVVFALLLLGFCEVLFLRDLFGNRMNTVFKFYYQSWVLLALAGAVMVYFLAMRWQGAGPAWRAAGAVFGVVAVVLVAASLVYPVAATISKSNSFASSPSLDGMVAFARFRPDEMEAIRWLNQNAPGLHHIAEASGGSYSQFGRASMATGLPTLLGWDFHERQWRGTAIDSEANARKRALETIFRAGPEAKELLRRYQVQYIFLGPQEREAYIKQDPAALERMKQIAFPVFQQGGVIVYQVQE